MQVDFKIILAAFLMAVCLCELASGCGGGGGGGGGGMGGGGGGNGGGGGGGGGDDGGGAMRARRRFAARRNVRRPAVRSAAAAKPTPAIVNHVHISLNQEQKKNSGNGLGVATSSQPAAGTKPAQQDPQMLINNQAQPDSSAASQGGGCTGSECPMMRSLPQGYPRPMAMQPLAYAPQYAMPYQAPGGYPQVAMPYQASASASAESLYEPASGDTSEPFVPMSAYNPYAGNARSPSPQDYYPYGQRGLPAQQAQFGAPQPAYRWS